MHLDVIVEDQVQMLVALQQSVRILQLEVLKLQHCLGPPTHHRLHKLVQNLHGVTQLLPARFLHFVYWASKQALTECTDQRKGAPGGHGRRCT